jgi:hypothetical protein
MSGLWGSAVCVQRRKWTCLTNLQDYTSKSVEAIRGYTTPDIHRLNVDPGGELPQLAKVRRVP